MVNIENIWNFGILRSYVGKVSCSFIHKIGDLGLETVEMKKYGNMEFGNPKILFGGGVIFLYKAFTKSLIAGSKQSTSKNISIWNLAISKSYFGKVRFHL